MSSHSELNSKTQLILTKNGNLFSAHRRETFKMSLIITSEILRINNLSKSPRFAFYYEVNSPRNEKQNYESYFLCSDNHPDFLITACVTASLI